MDEIYIMIQNFKEEDFVNSSQFHKTILQTIIRDGPFGPTLFPKGGVLVFLMYSYVALIRPILAIASLINIFSYQ